MSQMKVGYVSIYLERWFDRANFRVRNLVDKKLIILRKFDDCFQGSDVVGWLYVTRTEYVKKIVSKRRY